MPELPDFTPEARSKRGVWRRDFNSVTVPAGVSTEVKLITGRGICYGCYVYYFGGVNSVKTSNIAVFIDGLQVFGLAWQSFAMYGYIAPNPVESMLLLYDEVNNWFGSVVGKELEFDTSFQVKIIQSTGASRNYSLYTLYGLF